MWPPPFPPGNIADAIILLGWIGCAFLVALVVVAIFGYDLVRGFHRLALAVRRLTQNLAGITAKETTDD